MCCDSVRAYARFPKLGQLQLNQMNSLCIQMRATFPIYCFSNQL